MGNGNGRWRRYATCAALAVDIALGAAAMAHAATTYMAGEDLSSGDVVTFNASGGVIRTTSANDVVIGVVFQAATNGNPVAVETTDDITVNVATSTAALQYLNPSSTAGMAVGTGSPTSTTFGYSRTAESGGTLSMQFLRVDGGAGGGGSTTFQEDDSGSGTFTTLDVQKGFDGSVAANELDLSLDVDEVAGIAQSELVFFAPFDNEQSLAPNLRIGNADDLAATASGVGWFHSYLLEGDARDNGTDANSPTAGTALPASVTSTGVGIDCDGSTSDFPLPRASNLTLAVTEDLMGICIINGPSPSAQGAAFVSRSSSTGEGFIFQTEVSGSLSMRVRSTTTISTVSISGAVNGSEHTLVAVWDQTNMTGYRDGVQNSQVADNRVTTIDASNGNDYGFCNRSASNIVYFDGELKYVAFFKGTINGSADFPEYLENLTPEFQGIIGSRSMPGKFGEGRLYIGQDYESYSSEAFRPMRISGTISLWVQPTFDAAAASNDLATSDDPVIWQMDTDGTDGYALFYSVADEDWIFQITTGGTVYQARTQTNQTFNDGDWIHLTATWDAVNTRMRLYVDGTQVQQTTLTGEIIPTGELAANLFIGNEPAAGKTRAANAVLDHMKADNREWTATDVANDAAAIRPF